MKKQAFNLYFPFYLRYQGKEKVDLLDFTLLEGER